MAVVLNAGHCRDMGRTPGPVADATVDRVEIPLLSVGVR
jgi:hypothetical protein